MISHAPSGYVCPFCRLAQGDFAHPALLSTPQDVLFENEHVIAVIATHQWPGSPGNALIIPRAHHENFYELPLTLAEPIMTAAQQVARAMKVAYRCAGVSTRQYNEPAGNQDVWHYHLHVTPRFPQDDLYAHLAARDGVVMPPADRARLATQLRDTLRT